MESIDMKKEEAEPLKFEECKSMNIDAFARIRSLPRGSSGEEHKEEEIASITDGESDSEMPLLPLPTSTYSLPGMDSPRHVTVGHSLSRQFLRCNQVEETRKERLSRLPCFGWSREGRIAALKILGDTDPRSRIERLFRERGLVIPRQVDLNCHKIQPENIRSSCLQAMSKYIGGVSRFPRFELAFSLSIYRPKQLRNEVDDRIFQTVTVRRIPVVAVPAFTPPGIPSVGVLNACTIEWCNNENGDQHKERRLTTFDACVREACAQVFEEYGEFEVTYELRAFSVATLSSGSITDVPVVPPSIILDLDELFDHSLLSDLSEDYAMDQHEVPYFRVLVSRRTKVLDSKPLEEIVLQTTGSKSDRMSSTLVENSTVLGLHLIDHVLPLVMNSIYHTHREAASALFLVTAQFTSVTRKNHTVHSAALTPSTVAGLSGNEWVDREMNGFTRAFNDCRLEAQVEHMAVYL